MLKIVYPVCCGMAVHKSFVCAYIPSTDLQGVTAYRRGRFSTFTKDLCLCALWLAENNGQDVCMESIEKFRATPHNDNGLEMW